MFFYTVEQELRATSVKEGQRKTARSVPANTSLRMKTEEGAGTEAHEMPRSKFQEHRGYR